VLVTNCLLTAISAALAWQAFAGLGSLWLLYLLHVYELCTGTLNHQKRT